MAKTTSKSNNKPAISAEKEAPMAETTLQKVEGTSEYGAGDVYLAPLSSVWFEEDASAIDYDPRILKPISAEFQQGVNEKGVIESITVRRATNPKNPAQTLKCVNGKTRVRAARAAKLALIKVGIVDVDDKGALELQVMLNAHRFADEPSLQVANAARMRAAGFSIDAIASTFNLPKSMAIRTLQIEDKLVPAAKALVESDSLSIAAAEELARRPADVQEKVADIAKGLQEEAKASPKGKSSSITGSRKHDAKVEKKADGTQKVSVTTEAVTAIANAIEGKANETTTAKARAEKAAKGPDAPKAPKAPDAKALAQKEALAINVGMAKGPKGLGVGAEVHRAFTAGIVAALAYSQGKPLAMRSTCLTPEAKAALADALTAIFGEGAEKDETAAA